MTHDQLNSRPDMQAVLRELTRLSKEIASLQAVGGTLANSSTLQIQPFRERLHLLKYQLKNYAKTETLEPNRKTQTHAEQKWFGPAVRAASSHFHLRTNAGPARWLLGLSEVGMDIDYFLFKIRRELEIENVP
ncbi:hypothetical protein [Xanthomonas arboricola]|uniref:hypothetical protein n=1 Tax=Xanthomonas arboricola TaxID=56448 RepID=UPI001E290691|nr:hypothetical protein [Xanthomonas arboricola]